MKIKVLIFAAVFLAFLLGGIRHARASDHLVVSFGPTLNGNTNPKTAGLGYEYGFGEASLLAECRGIFSEQLNGACGVVFSAAVETLSGLFVRVGAGPAWVFRTDDRVSSNFNFDLQAMVGATSGKNRLGACYIHYSNAGLPLADPNPNLGRDFLTACAAFSL